MNIVGPPVWGWRLVDSPPMSQRSHIAISGNTAIWACSTACRAPSRVSSPTASPSSAQLARGDVDDRKRLRRGRAQRHLGGRVAAPLARHVAAALAALAVAPAAQARPSAQLARALQPFGLRLPARAEVFGVLPAQRALV